MNVTSEKKACIWVQFEIKISPHQTNKIIKLKAHLDETRDPCVRPPDCKQTKRLCSKHISEKQNPLNRLGRRKT